MTAQAVGSPPTNRPSSPATSLRPGPCQPGRPWPLGATVQEGGVNFAVYASVAHGLITGLLFFLAGAVKDRYGTGLHLHKLVLHETPNCWAEITDA